MVSTINSRHTDYVGEYGYVSSYTIVVVYNLFFNKFININSDVSFIVQSIQKHFRFFENSLKIREKVAQSYSNVGVVYVQAREYLDIN